MCALTAAVEDVAAALRRDGEVEGPLKGHHRDSYAVRIHPTGPRLKVSEPRSDVFWYDYRCCGSEQELIRELRPYVRRIPRVLGVDGQVCVSIFIEGRTLGETSAVDTAIDPHYLQQIAQLFRNLARFDTRILERQGICTRPGAVDKRDSTAFLRRMVDHTREHVYERNRTEYGRLFEALGIPEHALDRFVERVEKQGGLTRRPYRLLHADLHRENFIVDPDRRLWTIDWELAQVGDPLYDLVTHLHLMRYPQEQADEMFERWQRAVGEEVSPGADVDLPRYLDYKRMQSVYTDVIRGAVSLGASPDQSRLQHATAAVQRALEAAKQPLGIEKTPTPSEIELALSDWYRGRGRVESVTA